MKRVLFVDDEPQLLDGLRMRLRGLRHKWQMEFVTSGRLAIDTMEQQPPFDVIVCDQRMPEMDGATLLQTVLERWPHTIRIVLSGYAELEQTVRLVPVAHQYISKPCDTKHLENVIDRCISLHVLLQRPSLRAVVGRLGPLPPAPATYAQLQVAMASANTTIADIARLVSRDIVITAKLLQMVNSGFFRLPRRITTVEQAVGYLGLSTVRNLVVSAEVFSKWPSSEGARAVSLSMLQEHASRVAAVARVLVSDMPIANDTLLAALLHDIGYWVLTHQCARELAEAQALATLEGIPMDEAEQHVLGASQAEIGAYLLGIWGFPTAIVEAVAHHHAPGQVAQTGFDTLAALCIAHALAEPSEGAAFTGPAVTHREIESDYLDVVKAPFSWDEARGRASALASTGESAS
jgi:HD-like signal output (HDOD) protein/ActR/RegA family two-component response regulator